MKAPRPVVIDGTLYVLIAVFGAMSVTFGSESSYKYIDPMLLFWGKTFSGWLLAGVTALKMYRSTGYADHLKDNPTPKDDAKK